MDLIVTIDEHDISISVSYTASHQAARISGPPEDCYPEESELDIYELVITDKDNCPLDDAIIAQMITDIHLDYIEEKCWEDYHSQEPDYD